MKLGIVPCSGQASRWGGYPKYLLPCGKGEFLLDRLIYQFPCLRVVVIGDAPEIRNHLTRLNIQVDFVNQIKDWDLYGAIYAALPIEADYYYMGMPDTYLPDHIFQEMDLDGFSIGTFWTDRPEKYGMIRDDQIIDKQPGEPGWAWGCLGWNRQVRDFWLSLDLQNFPEILSATIQEFGCEYIEMPFYFDMENYDSYVRFLRDQ